MQTSNLEQRQIPVLIFKLLRVKHWLKSVFVLIGYFFSGLWQSHAIDVCLAVIAFCLASSAVYLYNDIADIELDKRHPIKKSRPIASGQISLEVVFPFFFLLMMASLGIAALLSKSAILIIALYLAINILYSHGLKQIPYLDVFCIGSGFMLRILMGTWAIDIVPSKWLLLCGTGLSLFLAFSKRYLELSLYHQNEYDFRPVLAKYKPKILSALLMFSALLSFISYYAYVFNMSSLLERGSYLIATIPFVILGFIRYLHRMKTNKTIVCPITLFIRDPLSLINLVGFVGLIYIVHY
jgi:4-hydroxybenzoate polyprenyltransferase